jgi:site-specific recombinase XerC
MPPVAKKHLHFDAWPDEDRALFLALFQDSDPFGEESRAAHMSAATRIGLRTAHARFLGFLASEDPERLRLSPEDRVDRESIRTFVEHLRKSCRDTSVASTLHKLRHFLELICPERDWSWVKTIANRIDAQATPRPDRSRGITSAMLFALGLRLMAEAEDSARAAGRITKKHALTYRDGLMIALLAAVPLRKRTFAALTINQHLVKLGSGWLLDIPAADTKTRLALEFPIPDTLSEPIGLYLTKFRTEITGADKHPGLWPSAKGHPMRGGAIYDAVCRRTIDGLGIPVNLHHFRSAAGNLWSTSDPANVRGAKDLLGHSNFGTTERHYIGAQSRLAGRALATALRTPRQR